MRKLILFVTFLFALNVFADISITPPPGGGGGGSGDIVGPVSATDDGIPTYDGTTGKLLQDSSFQVVADQILGPDGGVTVPAFSFANDPDSGMYLDGGYVKLAHQSQDVLRWSFSVIQVFKLTTFADGSEAQPIIGHNNDGGVGMYFPTTDQIGFSTSGTKRVHIKDANTEITNTPYVSTTGGTIIFVTPDASCSECGPDDSDTWSCTSVACP